MESTKLRNSTNSSSNNNLRNRNVSKADLFSDLPTFKPDYTAIKAGLSGFSDRLEGVLPFVGNRALFLRSKDVKVSDKEKRLNIRSWKITQRQATRQESILPPTQLRETNTSVSRPPESAYAPTPKSTKDGRSSHGVKHRCAFAGCSNTNMTPGVKMHRLPPPVEGEQPDGNAKWEKVVSYL